MPIQIEKSWRYCRYVRIHVRLTDKISAVGSHTASDLLSNKTKYIFMLRIRNKILIMILYINHSPKTPTIKNSVHDNMSASKQNPLHQKGLLLWNQFLLIVFYHIANNTWKPTEMLFKTNTYLNSIPIKLYLIFDITSYF